VEVVCPQCGAELSPEKRICPNCNIEGKVVGTQDFKPDEKGKQYNPFSNNIPMYIQKGRNIAASKSAKKKKKIPKVKNVFISEEIKSCPDFNKRKKKKYVDNNLDITKSCEDLALDG